MNKLCYLFCSTALLLTACQPPVGPSEGFGSTQPAAPATDTQQLSTADTTVTQAQPAQVVPFAGGKQINTGNVQPQQLVAFAQTLQGTPYYYGGTRPETGFDCSGFITYVFNHFGIAVPRSSIEFTPVGRTVPLAASRTGDLILFTGTDSAATAVGHMGIVVSNTDTLRFIHSTSGRQYAVTTSPLSPSYQRRFVRVARIFPD